MEKIESEDISEYVKAVIDGISEGIPDTHKLEGSIEFELAVINKKLKMEN